MNKMLDRIVWKLIVALAKWRKTSVVIGVTVDLRPDSRGVFSLREPKMLAHNCDVMG